MNAIQIIVADLVKQAKDLSHATMSQPMAEKQYILNVGKYQTLLSQAAALKKRFLDPEAHAAAADLELPDDLDDDQTITPPTRRDRVDQARRRHVPRSI